MMKRSQLLGFFFQACLCFSLSATTQNPTVVRAAIDIGMGGPKLQIAEVDPKTNKLVKMLHTQRYFVNFYEGISQHEENHLSPEVMSQGLQAFKEAVAIAHSFEADGIVAIGAAAFRAAANGEQFAQEIRSETGIEVHIADQHLEGKLAFQAALSKLDVDAEDLVVWDIGGGSVQFISRGPDGTYVVDGREEGVGAFKDFIIENIQHRNISEIIRPNPMSAEDIVHATNYALHLSSGYSQALKDKISKPTTVVIGVGSVFGYGIQGMLGGKNLFSIDDLAEVVLSLPGKTDDDLGGGGYAHVEGSNTVFVLGFMQNLNIEQMHIVNVNNADGAMIYEPFWK
jgi:exopolyphosphatase/guanosine-5'-triphosphate,3'-diphosphate pyrophosphatase